MAIVKIVLDHPQELVVGKKVQRFPKGTQEVAPEVADRLIRSGAARKHVAKTTKAAKEDNAG